MDRRDFAGLLEVQIAQVRRFNRFYERWLRQHRKGDLAHELTLGEVEVLRVIGESSDVGTCTAAWLAWRAALDAGYLSRILRKLRTEGLLAAVRSDDDGRKRWLTLTKSGMKLYRTIEDWDLTRMRQLLDDMPVMRRNTLATAMKLIEETLSRDYAEHLLEKVRGGPLFRRVSAWRGSPPSRP